MSLASRLYHGQTANPFVEKRRRWYAVSGLFVLISVVSLLTRGLSLGIDFEGGALFRFTPSVSVPDDRVTAVVTGAGAREAAVQKVGTGTKEYQVRTEVLKDAQIEKVAAALKKAFSPKGGTVSVDSVSATWGGQITNKAIQGLIAFLVFVIAYISLRFEWKMAISAIIALVHDLIITAGIYSLVGFVVTPSTVIATLTILGYSLYDTVVVFDKVRENTLGLAGSSRMTYSDAANLSINQTLMRSINTSLTSLLPVGALLFVGAGLLGAGTLKDLSLALFVGIASGTYSSIFVATPLLTEFKEREPQFKALANRVRQRAAAGGGSARLAAAAGAGSVAVRSAGAETASSSAGAAPARTGSGGSGSTGSSGSSGGSTASARPPQRGGQAQQRRKGKGGKGKGGRPSGKKRR
jgi:preprotein translocase subunit SecF